MVALFIVSIYAVYALTTNTNPTSNIAVTEIEDTTGATHHGHYTLDLDENNNRRAILRVSADVGYYVSGLTVKFGGNDIPLGFEAGAEQGSYFRRYEYSYDRDEYQFEIPEGASSSNKVQVTINYAKKDPINITYQEYNNQEYDGERATNPSNYGEENVLVTNYMDGDIVLPENCTDNGCLVKFKFSGVDSYNRYKSTVIGFDTEKTAEQLAEEGRSPWFKVESRYELENGEYEDGIFSNQEPCDDNTQTCEFIITRDFNKASYATMHVGYTDLYIFSKDFIGFTVKGDVNNFEDLLRETGNDLLGFDEQKKDASLQLFYGTKKLTLTKVEPKELINDGEKHTGTLRNFDNVTGSGYGYNTSYNAGKVTVTIDTYYQDELVLNLTVKDGVENLLPVSIKLHRLAFAGNGGELLEVDSIGRNCRENNNGNTCNEGVYYSTQYRGVLSSFYVSENTERKDDIQGHRIDDVNGNNIDISTVGNESGYARDKNFNPHVIALFYNEDDIIVETKDFDLNDEIYVGGCITKAHFNEAFSNPTTNNDVEDNEYVCTDANTPVKLKYIDYFGDHLEESIMHDIVLIGKDEAKQKGIVKIALFLVNGEVKKTDAPELNYGVGEGKIMYVREER